jgi:hypothetical protein
MPFAAVAGVKSLGEGISAALDVARLKIVSFKPNSVKTHTSSSEPPKQIKVVFVVPEVGLVIVAEKRWSTGEKMRIVSADATNTRFEDDDHKNDIVEVVSSGASVMARATSRERVSLMINFDGRIVAICVPFGLGRDWVDATAKHQL